MDASAGESHGGPAPSFSLVEKHKFPLPLFPEGRWSRKGFLRSRWRLRETQVDLVNVHLFHDASNLVSMEAAPSVYCNFRRRALRHVLDHLEEDAGGHGRRPFFVFGDFNFRLEGKDVLKRLSRGLSRVEGPLEAAASMPPESASSESSSDNLLQFLDEEKDQVVLSIGKKEFRVQGPALSDVFTRGWQQWRKYDRELSVGAGDRLIEMPLNFPPTYPFVEEPGESGGSYMETRCPAWCDRVLLNPGARALLAEATTEYDVVGREACMGDHKPVYLRLLLAPEGEPGSTDNATPVTFYLEGGAGRKDPILADQASASPVAGGGQVDGVPYSRYVEIKDVAHTTIFKETTV